MKPTKLMDEPELQRLQDWLAEYGLRVITEEHYQSLNDARINYDNWKWRIWARHRRQPLIGPPCPHHLIEELAAPAQLEPQPAQSPPRTDV